MNWKKKLLALGLSLTLTLSLTACGQKTSEPEQPEEPTQTEEPADKTQDGTEAATAHFRIAALKGPTAMGLVELMSLSDTANEMMEGKENVVSTGNTYEFTLAGSADEVTPALIKGDLDMACVPANLAAVLYGKTGGAVEVLPYANPTLTARLLGRCGADGTLRDDGDCVRVLCTGACSPVGGHNTVTVRYRLRPVGGSYSGYTALENGQEQIIEGVLKTASYELELSAVDALGSVRAVEYAIPTAAVAVHLAQGGTAVGVGKYAEHDKAVDIAPDWDVWFRGKRLLDAVWPVGSIYLSASEISPETLFGGTWEQVKDRFLLAAGDVYEPGETGGEAQHTLTKAEMPAHTHGYDFTGQSDVTGVTAIRLYDADGRRNEYQGASASAGGGAAHNNMPPYLVVYVWRRTA